MMLVIEMMYNTEIQFDEEYFFANKDIIKENNLFHLSHSIWDRIYDKLLQEDFINSIQDYVFLELHCSFLNADQFVAYFVQKCKSAKEYVILNQRKLTAIENIKKYQMIVEDENAIVSENIKSALLESNLYNTDFDAYNEVVRLAREFGY